MTRATAILPIARPVGVVAWLFTSLLVGFLGSGSARAQAPASGETTWRTSGERTVFEVTDTAVLNPVTNGQWRLRGAVEVKFTGRIKPHENSRLPLLGPGVAGLEGKFERVVLPEGWQGDLRYDLKGRTVTLANLRPKHAPAFPGAEGFGKYTTGGRGGRVIEVTNLNDRGPGSFRAAVEASGPRIVVFRVSGTIPLESEIKIRNPNLTIAGQTAPGDGICLKNYQVSFNTTNLIIRYLRFRPGDERGKEQDGFSGEGDQIIIDHCSVSWGVDETLSINKASNLTVQWCLVSESLTKSIHQKGAHGYGGLWGGPGGSWHHNLLAHHSSRNPRASGNAESGLMDFRNNVIYNWGFNSAYGGELWPRNWINNYYKYGPATSANVRRRIFLQKDPRGKMYCDGNVVDGFPVITANNWAGGIDFAPEGEATEATLRVKEPFVAAPVTTQSADDAYVLVLAGVGCCHARDLVDSRVVEEVRRGTASFGETYAGGGKGIIDSQNAVGGWPELRSRPAPVDTDHDGMPDEWEELHQLNPADPADGPQDANRDGYTNVEEYLDAAISLAWLWDAWEVVAEPKSVQDLQWLSGWWSCERRDFNREEAHYRDYGGFSYMKVNGWRRLGIESSNTWWFEAGDTYCLSPSRWAGFVSSVRPGPLGYIGGCFSLGGMQYDAFDMRRNPRRPQQELLLRHEVNGDMLLIEKVTDLRRQDELDDMPLDNHRRTKP